MILSEIQETITSLIAAVGDLQAATVNDNSPDVITLGSVTSSSAVLFDRLNTLNNQVLDLRTQH